MAIQPLTQRLLMTLGLGWCAFAGLGMGLRGLRAPAVTVIIDQSYCSPAQWQTSVIQPYRDLFQRSQSHQRQIAQVVVVTNMDQTALPQIPAPDELGQPFGQAPSADQLAEIQAQWPETVLLQCG